MNKNKELSEKATISLDLGTKTGWAVGRFGILTASGTNEFRAGRHEGGGMPFLRFRRWLDEMAKLNDPVGLVLYEEVRRHLGTDAAHTYGAYHGHLTAWCEQHSIPYQGVPVGTIKKHATGKGNAGKAEVMQAMANKGHRPRDDNEADALALLFWALDQEV